MPHDAVARVSCRKCWYSRTPNHKYTVVAVDCGIKHNIIRSLNARRCNVTVVPYDTPAEVIERHGAGRRVPLQRPRRPGGRAPVIELVKKLRGRVPIFGICLGHQMIGLACGAKTYKLKFGHRGGNHPCEESRTGKIEITSQNHSYAVDAAPLRAPA
jgi:carbamoyl-phosphate synthase small subunit